MLMGYLELVSRFFRFLLHGGWKARPWPGPLLAGPLSGLFARLNVAGLVFTVFELGGTWLYNRYNLSERDRWLQTTPWSLESELVHDSSLEAYAEAFARIGDSVTLDEVPVGR
ncbi:MAG: hypothetical protein MH186_06690 [Marinobacter sp.]|nr:hypothetical protein [Marinobacter sp.]